MSRALAPSKAHNGNLLCPGTERHTSHLPAAAVNLQPQRLRARSHNPFQRELRSPGWSGRGSFTRLRKRGKKSKLNTHTHIPTPLAMPTGGKTQQLLFTPRLGVICGLWRERVGAAVWAPWLLSTPVPRLPRQRPQHPAEKRSRVQGWGVSAVGEGRSRGFHCCRVQACSHGTPSAPPDPGCLKMP